MADVTFYNVTVTIDAPTSRAAYNRLCELLSPGWGDKGKECDVEFTTDTFTNHETGDDGDTMKLWTSRHMEDA